MSLHVSAMLYVSHFYLCDLTQLTRPCCVKTDLHYTDVYTLHFGTPSKDHDFQSDRDDPYLSTCWCRSLLCWALLVTASSCQCHRHCNHVSSSTKDSIIALTPKGCPSLQCWLIICAVIQISCEWPKAHFVSVAQGKNQLPRPSLSDCQLLEDYKLQLEDSKTASQLHQICAQLHFNGLSMACCIQMLASGLRSRSKFDLVAAGTPGHGELYVSKGCLVSQLQPTVFLMLQCIGRLAQKHPSCLAHLQLGPITLCGRSSLLLTLYFFGSMHQTIGHQRLP